MPAADFDTGLPLAGLDPERPRPIATPWGSFSLFVVGGAVVAVQSFCPHLAGPLFEGTQSGASITCPWHRWRFSLESGERLDAPRAGEPAPCLARCSVRLGPRGTLVLGPPRTA